MGFYALKVSGIQRMVSWYVHSCYDTNEVQNDTNKVKNDTNEVQMTQMKYKWRK